MDQPGGVYLRSATKISKEELIALQAAARMVLVAARGTLRQQLAATTPVAAKPRRLLRRAGSSAKSPPRPCAFMELKYFNGLGGFTEDGKEFVIYLGPGRQTPLPWINIMANPKFGAFVSESGAECVWGRNSQNDRLTPWFNDPISDPPGTAIYIRDDDIGVVWSPTPNRSGRRTPIVRGMVRVTQHLNTTATPSNNGCSPSCRSMMPADCRCACSGCACATIRRAGGS